MFPSKFIKILISYSFFIFQSSYASIDNKINILEKSSINDEEVNISTKHQYNLDVADKKIIEFDDLRELLIENNKDLKLLQSQIKQQKAILKSKYSAWYPTLTLKSNKLPQYTIGYDSKNLDDNTSSNQLSFGVNSNIEWGIIKPERKLEIKIAKEQLENSKLSFNSQTHELYLEVLKAFYRIQAANEEIKVAKKSINISKLSLEEAKNKLEAGIGNKLEVLEAKTQLDRDQINLVKKEGELKKNENNLKRLLNMPDVTKIKKEDVKNLRFLWSYNQKESLNAAYNNRLDLKINANNLSINNNKSLSILSQKKPSINLFNQTSFSSQRGETGVTSPNFENIKESSLNTIGISFAWNIFDGGKIKQNFISLREKDKELNQELLLNKAQIKNKLLDSLINLEIAKNNIIFSYDQLNSAEETLKISLKRMEAGLTTQREIVNIQGDVSESEKNFINSITEYNISLAELGRITLLEKTDLCQITKRDIKKQNKFFYEFIINNKLNSPCKKFV